MNNKGRVAIAGPGDSTISRVDFALLFQHSRTPLETMFGAWGKFNLSSRCLQNGPRVDRLSKRTHQNRHHSSGALPNPSALGLLILLLRGLGSMTFCS